MSDDIYAIVRNEFIGISNYESDTDSNNTSLRNELIGISNYDSDTDSNVTPNLEITEEDNIEEITTYDNYMKNSDIEKIIITNKNTVTGYLKFKTNSWKRLNNKNEIGVETLRG